MIVQATWIFVRHMEQDQCKAIGYIGIFKPFLDHHMVLLSDHRAREQLGVVHQAVRRLGRHRVTADNLSPEIHGLQFMAGSLNG